MFALASKQESAQALPEQRLWTAVLARAVEEWVSGPLRSSREAETYLFEDEADFPDVCRAAGLDPAAFRGKLGQLRRSAGAGAAAVVARNSVPPRRLELCAQPRCLHRSRSLPAA